MKIATWNVNSIRVRLPHVLQWLNDQAPDILVLQEIKTLDEDFPVAEFQKIGYQSIVNGQRTYNGMAILSKENGKDIITEIPELEDLQRRVLGVSIQGVRIINLYVPNGESTVSEKYQYKLNWLNHLTRFLSEELKRYPKMILAGDFNIAPQDEDVHDPLLWHERVLFSEKEKAVFKAILQLGFKDCFRLFPQAEKTFSWWDYRMNSFKRNLGLRIDHVLASNSLASDCLACGIDKIPRGWEKPSDHAVVWAVFK